MTSLPKSLTLFSIILVVVTAGCFVSYAVVTEANQDSLTTKTVIGSSPGTGTQGSDQIQGSTPEMVDDAIIYATKDGSETAQIWKMNLDGTAKKQLTNDQEHEHDWSRPSPDGKFILFSKAEKGQSVNFAIETNELWIMNPDGSNQHAIIDHAKRDKYGWKGLGHAEWSPDSNKIVLVVTLHNFTSQLFVVDVQGNNVEQISQTIKVDGQDANVSDPSWSNTGKIVYTRSWGCLLICSASDVFTLDYNTREEKRITNDPNWNFDPYISPDGKTFVWLSFRSSPIMCPCDLMKGNANGDLNPQAIIADGGSNANGTFSSDSKHLLFLKTIGFNQVLHRINLDGTGLTKIAPSPNGQTGIASYQLRKIDNTSTGNSGNPETEGVAVTSPKPPVTTTQPPVTTTKPPVTTTKPPVTTTKPPVSTTQPPVTTPIKVVVEPTNPKTTVTTLPNNTVKRSYRYSFWRLFFGL